MNIIDRKRLLRSTILAGFAAAGMSAAPAIAQDAEEETASSRDLIVVTGSLIARRDAIAESPIHTVSRDEIVTSGNTTLEHYLNTLPQITPGLSSQSNNPSSGGRAFIDLRGLGSARNLVLVDGRRAMGSLSGGTVDVNTIPAALIERVEIISGGAAATYGADAVAGVVNFILRRNFQGMAVDAQYRLTQEGDGEEYGLEFTLGSGFDGGRGNAVFSASYFSREAIYKGARAFSAQASSATGIFPGGAWTTGTNTPSQAAVDALFGANTCNANGGARGFGFNPDGSLFCTGVDGNPTRNAAGYTGPQSHIATAFYPDSFSYNFEPDNILVLPMERWNFYTHVNYDFNEYFRPYASVLFTNYNALQELAPTPAGGFSVPVTNPFIPTQLANLLATRGNPNAPFTFSKRFNDLGGRTGYNTHDVWLLTIGTEGAFLGDWTYDLFGSFGRSVRNEVQGGNVVLPRVQELLNAADGGASLCAGGLNLFGLTPISDACAARVGLTAKNMTVMEQVNLQGVIQGELFTLPAGAVSAAIGASYRSIDFDFLPDAGLQPGIVAGFNEQLPTTGFLDFVDVFGEVVVPILAGLPLADEVSLTLGARRTENNMSGSADSWRITGDWTVNDQLRFRGGIQQAVRSPNINELFAPQLNNFPNIAGQDPCNTTGAIAAQYRNGPNGAQVQALCAAQAAVAGDGAFVQPFGQAQAISGGNPNLAPEEARTYTFGFVTSSPFGDSNRFLNSLYVSADYWSIEMENVISAVGATTIIQRCFNRDGANPTYSINNQWCQLFNRDQSDGRIINLLQLSRNQSFINTSGVDIVVGWGFDLGSFGDLDFNLIATWVERWESQTTTVDPVNDFVGTIGSGTGSATPEWRFTLDTNYTRENWRVGLTTRYIDAMAHATTVTGGTAAGVSATWYVDGRVVYNLTDNVTLRMGVNNLFDQQPRLYNPNVQANTDPSTYDVLGRRFYVGVNLRM
ncbi:MAG: TonB-dependent receptor [Maricaulaceae bacterium]|nr:TonB-dependent receptor [Maricaulaceae bacterium]